MNKTIKKIFFGIGALAALSVVTSGLLYASNDSFADRVNSAVESFKGKKESNDDIDESNDDIDDEFLSFADGDLIRIDLVKMKDLLEKNGVDLSKIQLSSSESYILDRSVTFSNFIGMSFSDWNYISSSEDERMEEFLNSCDYTTTFADVCDGLGYFYYRADFYSGITSIGIMSGDLLVDNIHIYDFSLSDYTKFMRVLSMDEVLNIVAPAVPVPLG